MNIIRNLSFPRNETELNAKVIIKQGKNTINTRKHESVLVFDVTNEINDTTYIKSNTNKIFNIMLYIHN